MGTYLPEEGRFSKAMEDGQSGGGRRWKGHWQ